jgi:hypothetical protein
MLDVQCWMFSVGCSVLDVQFSSLAVRDSQLAFGVRNRQDVLELQAFTACSLGVI